MRPTWIRQLFRRPVATAVRRSPRLSRLEALEDRTVPAVLGANFYVANPSGFQIVADADGSGSLTVGDQVTWNPGGVAGAGGLHATKGAVTTDTAASQTGTGYLPPGDPGYAKLFLGTNAFTSIQSAYDTASNSDTIYVAAGAYAENSVTLNKSGLSILGAQTGVAATSGTARAKYGETVVRPNFSNAAQGNLYTVTANTVTLDGLTLDGEASAGGGIKAARGVANGNDKGTFTDIGGLSVKNNIIRNFDRFGAGLVSVTNPGGGSAFSNNFVDAPSGTPVAPTGANPASPTSGQTRYGLFFGGSAAQAVSGNTVGNADGQDPAVGIAVLNPTAAQTLTSNTVAGGVSGILALSSGQGVTVSGGSASGATGSGILFTNSFDALSGVTFTSTANSILTLSGGVSATAGSLATAVRLAGNTSVAKTLTLTLTGTNTIATGAGANTDSTTGLVLDGASSLLGSNSLGSTSFTGTSGQLVKLTNGAYTNAVVTGTGASYNGVAGGAALTPSQGLVIEDRLTHSLDTTGVGFVQIKSGSTYVTPASGSITRGFTAPAYASGQTVNIGGGSYTGAVNATAVTVTLAPASTTTKYGQVVVVGSLTLGATDTVAMDLAGPSGSDQIAVSGSGNALTAGGATLSLDYSGYTTPAFADTVKLFAGVSGAAAISGAFASPFNVTTPAAPPAAPTNTVTNGTDKYYYLYNYSGTNGDFVLTAAPGAATGQPAATVNTTFVDDDWASAKVGQVVADGANTRIFGYNAFGTIQGGVSAVDPASTANPPSPLSPTAPNFGTVNVRAGSYAELVTIPKAAKLYGPNAAVAGTGSRGLVATQAVVSATADGDNVFSVTASGVEVRGFEFKDAAKASVYAVTDFAGAGGLSNTVVQNNTFTYTSATPGVAVDLNGSNFGATASTGLLVDANLVTGATTGVNFTNGDAYGTVSSNTLTSIKGDGVFVANYSLLSAATLTLDKNTIGLAASGASGITLTNLAAGAGSYAVTQNTVTGVSGATGIAVTNSAGTGAVALSGNSVSGAGTGIKFDGVLAGSSTSDTVTSNTVGLQVAKSGGSTGTTTVSGLTATGNTTGVSVTGNTLVLSSGTITGTLPTTGSVGLGVSGGTATVTGGTFAKADKGIDFTGGSASVGGVTFSQANPNTTDLRVAAAGLSLGNTLAFAGTRLFIDNQSTTAYDLTALTGVSYYSQAAAAALSAASKADDYRIEDRLFHKVDDGTKGLVTFVTKSVFVTDPSVTNPGGGASTDSTIQNGVNAVPAGTGWTVNVERGSYTAGATLASKNGLTVLGAGSGFDAVSNGTTRQVGSATIESIVPAVSGSAFATGGATGTTVSGFDINAAGGTGINDTGGTATLSKNFVHGGTTGVAAAAGTTVSRSTITANGTGVSIDGATITVSENIVTGNTTAGVAFSAGARAGDSVTNNTLTGNGAAVLVSAGVTSLSTTKVYNNDLSGGTKTVSSASTSVLDAQGNYFAAGGAAAGTITGTAAVDFSPFLWLGTDTDTKMGFQGDLTNLGAAPSTSGADFDGGTDFRITEVVAYNSGSATVVHALAGTYAEAVSLSRTPLTLQAEGAVTLNSLAGVSGSTLATNGQAVTVGDATSTTFSGSVTGAAGSSLVKVGAGTLTLDGASGGYAGGVAVNVGTLTLAATGLLGSSAATATVASGATLADNGTFGGSVTVTGTLSGTGGNVGQSVTVQSGGLVTMTGTVGTTLTVNSGGTVSPAGTGSVGLLTVTGAATIAGTYKADLGASQAGSDQLAAAGFTLTGATFTGNVTAPSSNYAVFTPLDNTSATATAGTFTGIANAQFVTFPTDTQNFRAFYNFASTDFQLLRTPTNTAPSAVYVNDNWASSGLGLLPSGTITAYGLNPGAIGYDAYPEINLGVQSVPTGGTVNVYTGTYNAAGDQAGVSLTGNRTLRLLNDAANQPTLPTNRTIVDLQGSLSGDGTAKINLNRLAFSAGGTSPESATFAGVISGTGTFRKAGTGTLTLSGANTYNGPTQVTGGTLKLGVDNALPTTTAVTLTGTGSTLDVNNLEQTIGSLAGDASAVVLLGADVTVGGILTTGGNHANTVFGGVISQSGRVVKTGTGTLALTGANTYTAPTDGGPTTATTVQAGTLQFGTGGTTGSLAGGVVLGSGKLAVNRSDTVTQSTLMGGGLIADDGDPLTQDGGLVQTGPGTLTLSAGNTYAGGTLVSGGTLAVTADTQLGATAGGVTVGTTGRVAVGADLSTGRAFTLVGGTLAVDTGKTLILTGAVTGGTLAGPGTASVAGGTLTGVTIAPDAVVTVGSGGATFTGVTNAGTLTVPTGKTATFTVLTNATNGRVSVSGTVGFSALTSNGYVEIVNGGTMTNTGTATVQFGGGSTLNLGYTLTGGTGATAGTGTLDLNKVNLVVAGGVVRNNGLITSPIVSGSGKTAVFARVYVDTGSVYYTGDGTVRTTNVVVTTRAGGQTGSGFGV